MPSWGFLTKLAKALHGRAQELQGCEGGHEAYVQDILFTFAGVRILDKVFKDHFGTLPTSDLMPLLESYAGRFAAHLASLKKEADNMPASTFAAP